jgi:TRAP-type C4-dicarboxylate transport system permease small subunit
MDVFIRGVTLISQICGVFAAGLIAASVVIVCEMVFIRYVLNQNTIWQTDFVTFSIVAATFIGSPYLLLSRGHVNVDVLPLYLGQEGRFRLALASMLMSFAFCALMTVLTFQLWQEAWENNWRSESMWRARLWIPYAAMPVGLALLSLQYIAEIMKLVSGVNLPQVPALLAALIQNNSDRGRTSGPAHAVAERLHAIGVGSDRANGATTGITERG